METEKEERVGHGHREKGGGGEADGTTDVLGLPANKLPTTSTPPVSGVRSAFPVAKTKGPETGYSVEKDGRRPVGSIVAGWWDRERSVVLGRVGLVLRFCSLLFSLLSFSLMASDRTQGWSGDSYYRYKEYRYVMSVTVITFIYSGWQLLESLYQITKGKSFLPASAHTLFFTFAADQVLAYLLVSASSSGASLADDTQALWGKDPFTDKASGSVSFAFFAFITLAITSCISAHRFYNQNV